MKKCIALLVSLLLIIDPSTFVFAQNRSFLGLPQPGTMVDLSQTFMPVMIRGLKIHPDNPLLFDFIIDSGNSGLNVNTPGFKRESEKLVKYFLASLAIKEEDLWVNLSPYEKNRIIPNDLGKTDLGRDMLAQDYFLKQLTASLIYPEKSLGKKFWDEVYDKARQKYGTTDIPIETFNKVWIMADKAKILERNNAAFVVSSHLKVMLEEDFLALNKHGNFGTGMPTGKSHTVASEIVRTVIIPEIEKDVNNGKNFAPLRQIFYSMILSSWYKLAIKNALLNQLYSDKGKIGGVLSNDQTAKEKIYRQYLQAYKKGVFNYIKESIDTVSKQEIPRKYFSGGVHFYSNRNFLDREQSLLSGESINPVSQMARVVVGVEKVAPVAQAMVALPSNGKMAPNNGLEDTIKVIERARANMLSGSKHWDAVYVLTSRRNDAVASIERHLNQMESLYEHTHVRVVPSPSLYRIHGQIVQEGEITSKERGEFDQDEFNRNGGAFTITALGEALSQRRIELPLGNEVGFINDNVLPDRDLINDYPDVKISDEERRVLRTGDESAVRIINRGIMMKGDPEAVPNHKVSTGSFDLTLWFLNQLMQGKVKDEKQMGKDDKVLIILDVGSGSRLYPLVGALVGKGEVEIPHEIEGHLLELMDQVYFQSHMILEGMSEGGVVILANDQLWSLKENTKINGPITVTGHIYPMDKVLAELKNLGWVRQKSGSRRVLVLDEDKINEVTDEDAEERLMDTRLARLEEYKSKAPILYALTQLGHFVEGDNHGKVKEMVEKPKLWSQIKKFFVKSPVANWWNHAYTYEAIKKMQPAIEQHEIIGDNMDVSVDFLEAMVKANTELSYREWKEQSGREQRVGIMPVKKILGIQNGRGLLARLLARHVVRKYGGYDKLDEEKREVSIVNQHFYPADMIEIAEGLGIDALEISNIWKYMQRVWSNAEARSRRTFRFAQTVRATVGELSLVKGSHFIDVGTVPSAHTAFSGTLPDIEEREVVRHLLGLDQDVKVLEASPKTLEAIKRGDLIIDDGGLVVGGEILSGHVGKNSIVQDCFVQKLETGTGSWVYKLRQQGHTIQVNSGEVMVEMLSFDKSGAEGSYIATYPIDYKGKVAHEQLSPERSKQNRLAIRRFYEDSKSNAMTVDGGIALNAKNMEFNISKEGQGVRMKFNEAMIAEFRKGNFNGVKGIILKIIPLQSPLQMLGL